MIFLNKSHFSDTDYFKFIFFVFLWRSILHRFFALVLTGYFVSDQFMFVKLSLQAGCIVLV